MANKYRVYFKGNVVKDNVSEPITLPVEKGVSYNAGDFTYALLDGIGQELQKFSVPAFVAKDPEVVGGTAKTDDTASSSK